MLITQKSQYALRAIFELAKRSGQGCVKVAEIAEAQMIPLRFLEVILNQLKQGGFVASQRGSRGGYVLLRSPHELTVGEVLRFVQGPIAPVSCVAEHLNSKAACPLYGDCAFLPMWKRVQQAMSDIYDNTTFQDLIEEEQQKAEQGTWSYCI